MDKMQ